MNCGTLKIMVDTNVWLSYFEGNSEYAADTVALFDELSAMKAAVYAASSSLKDVYYLHQRDMKKSLYASGLAITKQLAAGVRESSWSCVRSMMELAMIVPIGQAEALRATTLRELHNDFEDDLILAAADRIQADYLVTTDKRLTKHAPVACLCPADMIALLRARAQASEEAE